MTIQVRKLFKEVWSNLYRHKFTYYSRAVLLQLVMTSLGVGLMKLVFQFILLTSGQENLTKDSLFSMLVNPVSLALIVLFILVMAGLIFFEFSVLTLMVYGSYQEDYFSWKSLLKNAWLSFRKLNWRQFPVFLLYLISMVPVANLGLSSILTENLFIPKFISGELTKTSLGAVAYPLALLFFSYINLRLLFTLPLTVTNDLTIWDNIKRSWKLTRKGKFKLGLVWGSFELIFTFLTLLLLTFLLIIMVLLDPQGSNLLYETIFFTGLKVLIFFFSLLSKLSIVAIMVRIIMEEKELSASILAHEKEEPKKSKVLSLLITLALLLSLVNNSLILFTVDLNPNSLTIGHRGYVSKGVENSLEGLEGAAKEGVDYVEMDILLTKDHKFVVMHDYNLKRLVGLDKQVADMTFDEVVGLPISQDGHKSKLPSFEEFVQKAKELKVKLLVELKPHGSEPDNYVDLFIAEMRRLGVDRDYKVMSLDLKVMEAIEEKAPEMDTGYVIPLQFGDFAKNKVDFFVIEDFSYNDGLVAQAQKEKKEVFVWTINEEDQMVKYLEKPVTGIITDYPNLVKKEKQELKEKNTYFDKLLRQLVTSLK
ncbi:glycerophosphoryl diester phosphodiesterase membrane domain-containing protein [Streptococcus oricebi]|uniref:Glycerophosphodiester phosphodiesterase n=1 Tax=Streptococcus oricebi TaxID=1547447 RepID=A0ABS5B2X0_9STRE|nr:glycerophosphodiester phosphodiesterase [Streptococcus oricebi]MBP2623187.1 glycerophosphodiester phosphodiesterase [Streptococcus oricebi]